MLKHAAEAPDTLDSMSEAAAVVSNLLAIARLVDVCELAPPRARRMSHDRMRAIVVSGVAVDVPRVDAGKAEVNAVRLDVERGDGADHDDGQKVETMVDSTSSVSS